MNPQLVTIVRFVVAVGVGYLVALLAKQGIHVPDALEQTIVLLITGFAAGLVNGVINWLSHRFPWLGHLLAVKPPARKAVAR